MGKIMNLTYASSLTDLCNVNSSFDSGVLRICYTGENHNHSYLSKETIERSIKSIYNCPVVCNYDRDTDTLGGHDVELVSGDDGALRLVNATQPVGVIPESARTWWEEYEEDDGIVHEYLCADVLLWKRQEAYRKIKRDGITAHSMEISVKDGKSKDGVYYINDFEFTAFALIGVSPCFESSALEVFAAADFKQQFSEMMQDLRETFSLVNTSTGVEDNTTEDDSEGGKETLDIDMTTETATATVITGTISDVTAEELDFTTTVATTAEEQAEETFELSRNIADELAREIEKNGGMFRPEWLEHDISHYELVDYDAEASEVYIFDQCDGSVYGCPYTMNGDHPQIDFEAKKRMKWVLAEVNEGEQPEEPSPLPMFTLMEDRLNELAGVEAKYSEATVQVEAMQGELTGLREFKAAADAAAAKAERDEVLAKFEDLVGVEAFEELRDNCADYDVDALEEKCFAIRGRTGAALKFSAEEKSLRLPVETVDESNDEPYGGLFARYMKTN